MDERLERELRDVQRFYNHRRSFRLKAVIVAVVTFAIAAILLFFHFISSPRVDKAPHAGVLPSQALPVVKVESAARTTAAAGLFRLSGILDLGEGLRAVINDEVVGVGDQVAKQAIVRHIASDSVILEVRGREVLLRL